jgi:hypothetical protein
MSASMEFSYPSDTPAYYVGVARKLEHLSEYVRAHENVDCGISDRLKAFADEIRQDIAPRVDADTAAESGDIAIPELHPELVEG